MKVGAEPGQEATEGMLRELHSRAKSKIKAALLHTNMWPLTAPETKSVLTLSVSGKWILHTSTFPWPAPSLLVPAGEPGDTPKAASRETPQSGSSSLCFPFPSLYHFLPFSSQENPTFTCSKAHFLHIADQKCSSGLSPPETSRQHWKKHQGHH